METLIKNVTNTWGENGKKWLNQLPSLIEALSNHWSLTDIKPVTNMSYNYVALAIQKKNIAVVLKMSCDKQLIEDEYRALKHFAGLGSVKVFDINTDHNALLLEQAIPGRLLKEHHPVKIEDSIEIYAQVVKALSSRPLTKNDYTHVSQWCKAINRIKDKRIEKRYIKKAKELKEYLLSSAENEYICHGDLHLENIIAHGKNWLSIDPKGIIGEIAFEAAAFDLINKNEWKEPGTIHDKIFTRVNCLANCLQIDKDRLLAWIFLRIIISAQWFIEDNANPDETLQLASVIYPLITKHYNKDNVCDTYEEISDWYLEHRSHELFEKPYLDKVISLIKSHGSILDLGCGTGQPIAEYFIKKGFTVTGVDGSESQIKKAKINCPDLFVIHEDMRKLNLSEKFNCIIAWHSYFHLTQDDQRTMFKVFEKHIHPGGVLVFTSGPKESEVWTDNGGELLYHASLSTEEYQSLLLQHHFEMICHKVEDPECGDATIWVAKYHDVKH